MNATDKKFNLLLMSLSSFVFIKRTESYLFINFTTVLNRIYLFIIMKLQINIIISFKSISLYITFLREIKQKIEVFVALSIINAALQSKR